MADSHRDPTAPGDLEFVRAFVNTRDIDAHTDLLSSVDGWSDWAHLVNIDGGADPDGLNRATQLRELLRQAMRANHEGLPLPASAAEALTDAAQWSGVVVAFAEHGLVLDTKQEGIVGAVGRVVAATAHALTDGSWTRLKACANDECQWAFYDHSRSRTGRWCSMGLCGNRAKQNRWREKQE